MSLILEALKKAERQHKLGEVPGLSAHSGDQPGHRGGRAGWVMLGLFAVVMLLAGAYLGGGLQFASPTPQRAASSSDPAPVAAAGGELSARPVHARTDPSARQPGRQPEGGTPAQADAVMPESAPSTVAAMPQAAPPPIPDSEANPEPKPEPRPAPRVVPKPPPRPLNEMPAGFVSSLPSMNIDIHSYDQRPEKRYVLINMTRYREGDYLSEGPLIISIRPDGVEMEHMGARFILPIGAP
ncbi:MAG: general secretion pathway protein GspB [Candidatus Thiodiazotropha sp.]